MWQLFVIAGGLDPPPSDADLCPTGSPKPESGAENDFSGSSPSYLSSLLPWFPADNFV